MRAHFEEVPVVLASATPAIETRHMVEIGSYRELQAARPLRRRAAARHGRARPARRTRRRAAAGWRRLWSRALEANLEAGEQSLLFLNRRGYAPLTLCRHCGYRFQCPNCTAWMVEHRFTRRLACHHCGHVMPAPQACPECSEEDSLVACGPGVERIADEVAALFPEARTAIVTSDTIWSPAKAAEFVARMEAGEIDIVIGTQLVTKGYHFPNLTLVGVVDADLGLAGGDLRAAERSFQQIRQVAGRAGRGEKPGRVLVQTHDPDAPVIQRAGERRRRGLLRRRDRSPARGRHAALRPARRDHRLLRGPGRGDRDRPRDRPRRAGPRQMAVFGPAPAPLAMLRGRHRHRLLVHAARAVPVQEIIRDWLGGLELEEQRPGQRRRRSLFVSVGNQAKRGYLAFRGCRAAKM